MHSSSFLSSYMSGRSLADLVARLTNLPRQHEAQLADLRRAWYNDHHADLERVRQLTGRKEGRVWKPDLPRRVIAATSAMG